MYRKVVFAVKLTLDQTHPPPRSWYVEYVLSTKMKQIK
jgi:hypothetical protein